MMREYAEIPYYVRSMGRLRSGFPKGMKVIGADTETGCATPLLFQFCDGKDSRVMEVDEFSATKKFFEYLNSLPSGKYCMFFHNLEFDLVMLFYPLKEILLSDTASFSWIDGKWKVSIVYGKCRFATLKCRSKTVYILDSFQFFRSSLKNLSMKLNLRHKKIDPPEGLGKDRRISPELVKYARMDAWTEYDLGKLIVEYHRDFSVRPSVSIAQFSCRIFKRHFIRKAMISIPPKEILEPSILSYHGGLNIFRAEPGVYPDVYEIDINSAYPYAMTQIPNFSRCTYRPVDDLSHDLEGIYRVSGYVKDTKYPCLYAHDFRHLNDEYIHDIWTTSYELKEALDSKSFDMTSIQGYVVEERENECNPFREFAQRFYSMKEKAESESPDYYMWKLILNSLYGKLIQGIVIDPYAPISIIDPDTWTFTHLPVKYRAGGLFQPFIASLITGYIRAMLRNKAMEYEALDTSTDSLKTLKEPKKKDLGTEMGKWSIKEFGPCLFLRNKLYIHFGEKISSGLHGFRGNTKDLLRLWYEKKDEYDYRRMMKLRESYIRTERPLPMSFHIESARLNIFSGLKTSRPSYDDTFDIRGETDSSLTPAEKTAELERKISPSFSDVLGESG